MARRDRVDVYGWVGGDTPHDVLNAAKARKEQGFKVLKMNATGILGMIDSPAKLDAAVERVRQVKSLGMDVGLDFLGRLHKGMAKQLLRKLEAVEPYFVEEPLLPYQQEELSRLYQQTSIPIATGERLYSRFECRPYFEKVSQCRSLLHKYVLSRSGLYGHLSIRCLALRWDIRIEADRRAS
jgi:galactonate dehydratase